MFNGLPGGAGTGDRHHGPVPVPDAHRRLWRGILFKRFGHGDRRSETLRHRRTDDVRLSAGNHHTGGVAAAGSRPLHPLRGGFHQPHPHRPETAVAPLHGGPRKPYTDARRPGVGGDHAIARRNLCRRPSGPHRRPLRGDSVVDVPDAGLPHLPDHRQPHRRRATAPGQTTPPTIAMQPISAPFWRSSRNTTCRNGRWASMPNSST